MTARALLAIGAAALVGLASEDANACDCSTPAREREYAQAARVVVVRIDPGSPAAHTERDGRPRKATLPVERSFKGGNEPTVEVKLSAGKDCVYFPAEPGKHLVYLHARHDGGPLEASICGHNGLVASSRGAEEIAALEAAMRDATAPAATATASSAPAAPSAQPSAAPSAPTPPTPPGRGCAGCTTTASPAGGSLALALGLGALVARWRRRGAR